MAARPLMSAGATEAGQPPDTAGQRPAPQESDPRFSSLRIATATIAITPITIPIPKPARIRASNVALPLMTASPCDLLTAGLQTLLWVALDSEGQVLAGFTTAGPASWSYHRPLRSEVTHWPCLGGTTCCSCPKSRMTCLFRTVHLVRPLGHAGGMPDLVGYQTERAH